MDFMIGEPYAFRLFNCWDYVSKIRSNNGIKTKLFKPKNLNNAFKLIKTEMQKLEHGLIKVDTPENFDIVITRKGNIYHCGIYFNDDVMHCSRAYKQVIKETFADFIKPYESFTLWR